MTRSASDTLYSGEADGDPLRGLGLYASALRHEAYVIRQILGEPPDDSDLELASKMELVAEQVDGIRIRAEAEVTKALIGFAATVEKEYPELQDVAESLRDGEWSRMAI